MSSFQTCSKYCGEVTFTHPEPWRFCSSNWVPLPFFLFYRFLMAFYPLAWIIYSIVMVKDTLKWFIFIENWFSLLLLLYFQIVWWLSFFRLVQSDRYTLTRGDLYFTEKYCWACFNVVVSMAPTLLAIFFWEIYPKFGFGNQEFVTFNELFVVPILMVVEIVVSSMPLRVAHVYCPLVFGLCYIGFAVGYELGGFTSTDGGHYIYSTLSITSKTGITIGFAFALEGALLGFFIFFCAIAKLRDTIFTAICWNTSNKYLVVEN